MIQCSRMIISIFTASTFSLAALCLVPAPALAKKGGKGLHIKVRMANPGVDPDAKGDAELRQRSNGTRFKVQAQNLDPGVYDIRIGGVKQASINVGSRGKLEAEFRTDQDSGKSHPPLTFDPKGQRVEVMQGATVFLSVMFPTEPTGGKNGQKSHVDSKDVSGDGLAGGLPTEPISRDPGVFLALPSGWEACGSGCKRPATGGPPLSKEVWCNNQKACTKRGSDCGCHLFRKNRKGPKKLEYVSKPGKKVKSNNAKYTYHCHCVH